MKGGLTQGHRENEEKGERGKGRGQASAPPEEDEEGGPARLAGPEGQAEEGGPVTALPDFDGGKAGGWEGKKLTQGHGGTEGRGRRSRAAQ